MCDPVGLAEESELGTKLRAIVLADDMGPAKICKPSLQMGKQVSGSCIGDLCCPSVATVAVYHSEPILSSCSKQVQAGAAHRLDSL